MFTKSDLLFTGIKSGIKLFLSKFGTKASGVHDKEYREAVNRYKELVNDISFQDKIQELSLLEALIIQTQCMQNIRPIVYTNITAPMPSVYARVNYPSIRRKSPILVRSLGPRRMFNGSIRQIAKDPAILDMAKIKLRQAMEENFIYKAYKLRYPNQ